jgi:CheY-like chemotaxis protein
VDVLWRKQRADYVGSDRPVTLAMARSASEGRGAETQSRRMAIVAVTANASEDDRRQWIVAGMDDFLAKPYRGEQLEQVLARWLTPAFTRRASSRQRGADRRSAGSDLTTTRPTLVERPASDAPANLRGLARPIVAAIARLATARLSR